MVHRCSIPVRFAELDPYGHLNHAVYATYFETARIAALRDHDLELTAMAEGGYQLVVTTITLDFKQPAVANDVVEITTWVTETGRASSVWSQQMRRDGALVASARVKAAVTDLTGRPTRPPEWLWERLEPLRAPSADA